MISPVRLAGAAADAGASEAGASDAGASDAAGAEVAVPPLLQAAATMTSPVSSAASRRCRFIGCVMLLSLW